MLRVRVAAAGCAAALLIPAPLASANGDPASDYLLGQSAFLPIESNVTPTQGNAFTAFLGAAADAGFGIKVAIIAHDFDLGADPQFFRKAEAYAQHLSGELASAWKGGVLVLMPNGYGVAQRGKPLAREQKVVDALAPPGDDGAAMVTAAGVAVEKLAALHGVTVTAPAGPEAAKPDEGNDRLVIILASVSAAVLVAAVYLARRLRRR